MQINHRKGSPMLQFLKNIFTLIFSPASGWNEVSFCNADPKALVRTSLLPLLIVTGLSVFFRLIFREISVLATIELAVTTFGGLFVSLYIGNLLLEALLPRITDGKPNHVKCFTVSIYAISLLAFYEILLNVVPVDLGFLKFLPILIALVIFKASRYLDIKADNEFTFLLCSGLSLVLVPLTILFCLDLFII